MNVKDLIAALGVLANPNASDEEKAAALDKLSAYFNSLLDGASTETEGASETADDKSDKEKTSETGDEKSDDEEKKEMSSALAAANETIQTLTDRVAKLEKASAIGTRPRASRPTVIQREQTAAPMDPQSAVTISMIEKAAENTKRMLGK